MNWTQPICDDCYHELYPERPAPRKVAPEYRDIEECCVCGYKTNDGIYVRIDPRTVTYPTNERD